MIQRHILTQDCMQAYQFSPEGSPGIIRLAPFQIPASDPLKGAVKPDGKLCPENFTIAVINGGVYCAVEDTKELKLTVYQFFR